MKTAPDEKALYFSQKLHERIGPELRQLILFGSRARGDAQTHIASAEKMVDSISTFLVKYGHSS